MYDIIGDKEMELGVIGLGRMGANMAIRLLNGGHRIVGYARTRETVDSMVEKGIDGAYSLDEMVQKLPSPCIIWLMIPAGNPIDKTIEQLLSKLKQGDIIVEGGNSNSKNY